MKRRIKEIRIKWQFHSTKFAINSYEIVQNMYTVKFRNMLQIINIPLDIAWLIQY